MERIENRYRIQELDDKIIRKYLLKLQKIRQNTLLKIRNKSKDFKIKTIIKYSFNSSYGNFGKIQNNCVLSYDVRMLKQLIKFTINKKRDDKNKINCKRFYN